MDTVGKKVSPDAAASHQHQKRWLVITYLVFLAGGALWGLGEEVQLAGGTSLGPVIMFAAGAAHLVLRYLIFRRELEKGKIVTTSIARLMRKNVPIENARKHSALVIVEMVSGSGLLLLYLATDAVWLVPLGVSIGLFGGATTIYLLYVAALYTGRGID